MFNKNRKQINKHAINHDKQRMDDKIKYKTYVIE